ncbi:MAG: hypothetical protein IPK79_04010 [Vampirovibrionales bacterium]|nr:hypothetical protein [Vampirovibrionales bacterium]
MSFANIGISSAIQKYGPLTGPLAWLSERPLAELLFKDVSCFNAPKMALARTGPELIDVAELELPNTAVTLLASVLLPPWLQRGMSKVTGLPQEQLTQSVEELVKSSAKPVENVLSKIKLAKLGASLAFFFPFAAGFWAVPFLRNYMTLARTNTANFDAIVGLEGEKNQTGSGRSVPEEKSHQLGMVIKVIGTGVALGAASFFGFGKLAKRFAGEQLPKHLETFFKTFRLGGKKGNEIEGDWATLVFWSMPAYLGWIHAARTKNERIEQTVKAANSIMWFSVLNPVVNLLFYKNAFKRLLNKPVEKNVLKAILRQSKDDFSIPKYADILHHPDFEGKRAALLKLKNRQYGLGLLQSVVLLGSTPQMLNIYFTKRRHERALASQRAAAQQRTAYAVINPFGGAARVSVSPGLVVRTDSPFSALTQARRAAMT